MRILFCGRRPLPFGGSHLRLPSGSAGIRTTTGSLSALARPRPYQLAIGSPKQNNMRRGTSKRKKKQASCCVNWLRASLSNGCGFGLGVLFVCACLWVVVLPVLFFSSCFVWFTHMDSYMDYVEVRTRSLLQPSNVTACMFQVSSWLSWYRGTLVSLTDCRWWFDSPLVRE